MGDKMSNAGDDLMSEERRGTSAFAALDAFRMGPRCNAVCALANQTVAARHENDDPRLRSCLRVIGCHIHATDGDVGHVRGLLVDEETWTIRHIVVDTSNWQVGHRGLIAPVNHANSADAIAAYGPEPYVVASDVCAFPPHVGRGGWTWYTGSAGWTYRFIPMTAGSARSR